MKGIAASFANKLMSMTIRRFRMTTLGTTFRRVLGVNLNYFKAEVSRFVLQELFQLVKRPRIDIFALLFAQSLFGVFADAVQVLNRNRRVAGLFGKVNNTSANDVVRISQDLRPSRIHPPPKVGGPLRGILWHSWRLPW